MRSIINISLIINYIANLLNEKDVIAFSNVCKNIRRKINWRAYTLSKYGVDAGREYVWLKLTNNIFKGFIMYYPYKKLIHEGIYTIIGDNKYIESAELKNVFIVTLKKIPRLKRIIIEDHIDLRIRIQNCRNLENLDISRAENPEYKITIIDSPRLIINVDYNNITKLRLINCGINKFNHKLPQVKTLDLSYNNISRFYKLKMPAIKYLYLNNNPLCYIGSIANYKKIKLINVLETYINRIPGIEVIKHTLNIYIDTICGFDMRPLKRIPDNIIINTK